MRTALAERLDEIVEKAGVNQNEIARLLDSRPETVSRWRNGKISPQGDRLDRILELNYLAGELAELYDPDEARLWLLTRNRLLDGDAPADRIQKGAAKDVLDLITRLKDGAYV